MASFLEARCALGRNPASYAKTLRCLDNFLVAELEPGQAITRELIEKWIREMRMLSVGTRINRISVLRQFCLYMSHFDQRTCLVPPRCTPRRTRPAPHIYSSEEVQSLLHEASRIGPQGSMQSATMVTLIGLLYATGLRIGEALKLTLGDVDAQQRLLTVRLTKFRKSRYVPLSPSAAKALTAFLERRALAGLPTTPQAAVFSSCQTGRGYHATRIYTMFLEIARRLGIRGKPGIRGPRLHDFRHTFAVQRLLLWYRERAELYAKLPLLSTYLGHNSVTYTEVYLQATAELLEEANARFHARYAVPSLDLIQKEISHV
jgi:integrase